MQGCATGAQRRRYGDTPSWMRSCSRYYHQMASNIEDRQRLRRLLADDIPQTLGIGRAALLLLDEHELVGGTIYGWLSIT